MEMSESAAICFLSLQGYLRHILSLLSLSLSPLSLFISSLSSPPSGTFSLYSLSLFSLGVLSFLLSSRSYALDLAPSLLSLDTLSLSVFPSLWAILATFLRHSFLLRPPRPLPPTNSTVVPSPNSPWHALRERERALQRGLSCHCHLALRWDFRFVGLKPSQSDWDR